jgi:hypothetical protein
MGHLQFDVGSLEINENLVHYIAENIPSQNVECDLKSKCKQFDDQKKRYGGK